MLRDDEQPSKVPFNGLFATARNDKEFVRSYLGNGNIANTSPRELDVFYSISPAEFTIFGSTSCNTASAVIGTSINTGRVRNVAKEDVATTGGTFKNACKVEVDRLNLGPR